MTASLIVVPEVEVGQQVLNATAQPNNLDCFLLGAAYWTSHRIHYDRGWAQKEGYADVVVPGVLLYSWLERLIVQWAGSPQVVKSYRFRHTGFPTVQDTLVFSGTVSEVVRKSDLTDVYLELDVHAVDERSIIVGQSRLRFASACPDAH